MPVPVLKLDLEGDSGQSVMTPSDNSSFSFTPSVVKPELAERYKLEAELTTKLALATKQFKRSPRENYASAYSVSDSGKSTNSPSSARGTPCGNEQANRNINI